MEGTGFTDFNRSWLMALPLVFLAGETSAQPDRIYFSHSSVAIRAIRTVELDSLAIQTFEDVSPYFPKGVALDPLSEMVYWVEATPNDNEPGTMWRRGLSGASAAEDITPDGLSRPRGIQIDPIGGHVYYVDRASGIYRADLDGSHPALIIPAILPSRIKLDFFAAKIYFVHGGSGPTKIGRVNFDGEEPEPDFLLAEGVVNGIALDRDEGYIYFNLRELRKIQRAALADGTGVADVLIDLPHKPLDLAIDPIARDLYWSFTGVIERLSLDGAQEIETIVEGLRGLSGTNGINYLALDIEPQLPGCYDGIDNDSDGEIDFPNDDGCSDATDRSEVLSCGLGWELVLAAPLLGVLRRRLLSRN